MRVDAYFPVIHNASLALMYKFNRVFNGDNVIFAGAIGHIDDCRERIHAHFEVFAKWMRDRQGVDPELVIREGEPVPEIMAQVKDDPEIGVLVLGAGTDNKGTGPLVTQLSRNSGSLPASIIASLSGE